MTNREWLESLSDEELAEKLYDCSECIFDGSCIGEYYCEDGHLKWLRAEHEETNNG